MKSLDILKKVISLGYLPDCGVVEYRRDSWGGESSFCRNFFGGKDHNPKEVLSEGEYFYLYAEDYVDVMPDMPAATMIVETEDSGNVWLWKIDE